LRLYLTDAVCIRKKGLYQVNLFTWQLQFCGAVCLRDIYIQKHPWRYLCEGKPRDARACDRITTCVCCKSIVLRYVIMEVMPHVPADGAQDYCWARLKFERLEDEVNDVAINFLIRQSRQTN
jgi:hypothetical protein